MEWIHELLNRLSGEVSVTLDRSDFLKAAAANDLKEMKRLIKQGADVNDTNEYGETGLTIAAKSGFAEIAEFLIRQGADVNAREFDGATPLMAASLKGHPSIVRMLLEKGAEVNVRTKEGFTALFGASGKGFAESVRLLLERGADVNAAEQHGITALMVASLFGHREVVELLLKYGADVDAKDEDGKTSLGLARYGVIGKWPISSLLTEQRARHEEELPVKGVGMKHPSSGVRMGRCGGEMSLPSAGWRSVALLLPISEAKPRSVGRSRGLS